jgi:hypothetical protein
VGGAGGGDLSGGGCLFDVAEGEGEFAVVGGGLQLFAVVGPEFLRADGRKESQKGAKKWTARAAWNSFCAFLLRKSCAGQMAEALIITREWGDRGTGSDFPEAGHLSLICALTPWSGCLVNQVRFSRLLFPRKSIQAWMPWDVS